MLVPEKLIKVFGLFRLSTLPLLLKKKTGAHLLVHQSFLNFIVVKIDGLSVQS